MFTGIVEALGKVLALQPEGENLHINLQSPFTHELKIDQSVAHNGVCLTVVAINEDAYTVTAIKETLLKTSLNSIKPGSLINLERCLKSDGRFDGHIVQGHVDQTGTCEKILEENGSWRFYFSYDASKGNITVEKGSICINGVSLTVVDSTDDSFSVAIIPYTYEHTSFRQLIVGEKVNLEFDILGKYISKILAKAGKI
ncbi:MAG: riboflavin synthase [Bacteroidetes bacterium]|nr:riboflavin synthase [Bacteroidota bacterium]